MRPARFTAGLICSERNFWIAKQDTERLAVAGDEHPYRVRRAVARVNRERPGFRRHGRTCCLVHPRLWRSQQGRRACPAVLAGHDGCRDLAEDDEYMTGVGKGPPPYSNAAARQRRAAAPVTIPASRPAPIAWGRLLATAVARARQSRPHSLSSQLCASQAMPRMRSG
jgi:hypothetical protein